MICRGHDAVAVTRGQHPGRAHAAVVTEEPLHGSASRGLPPDQIGSAIAIEIASRLDRPIGVAAEKPLRDDRPCGIADPADVAGGRVAPPHEIANSVGVEIDQARGRSGNFRQRLRGGGQEVGWVEGDRRDLGRERVDRRLRPVDAGAERQVAGMAAGPRGTPDQVVRPLQLRRQVVGRLDREGHRVPGIEGQRILRHAAGHGGRIVDRILLAEEAVDEIIGVQRGEEVPFAVRVGLRDGVGLRKGLEAERGEVRRA